MCDYIRLMCEYFIEGAFLLWTGADSLRIRDIQPWTGAISLHIRGIPLCISAASFRSCVSHFLGWGHLLCAFSLSFLMFVQKKVCGLCFSAFASFDLRYNRSYSF